MEREKSEISAWQTILMSVTAGVCVANIYYNQPLLKDMADSFHTNERMIGNMAVLAQAGYGLGLFFITPLGDKMNRRKLILLLQWLLVLALLGMTFSDSLHVTMAMSLLVGIFSVAAQVILPMAADLSPHNKGKIVDIIFMGILTGILAARVLSGFIAEWLSWRYVYGIAAPMVLATSIVLYKSLPDIPAVFKGSYPDLLRSTLQQLKRFSVLRRTALLGGLMFGVFCSFWTTLTFYLSGTPFRYSTDQIGLFGVLAIFSALLAPMFRLLADRGGANRSRLLAVMLVICAIIVSYGFPGLLWAALVAVLLLNLGVQAVQVTNVAVIYTLDETAYSRINTVYMTSYFLGGALGTYSGLFFWQWGQWSAVCLQLLIFSLVGFIQLLHKVPLPLSLKEGK
ncbi:MFS transporter [Chryseobacterium sp. FH2]|uniref:MFS transporter n=1 Tax=Chryseobacterium sp. FH2 TaxID=1674291 RepID=UPI00065AF15C|nr:MFS transporter [Chryseobacterium sp. FH2]KMQ65303.1 MFS transporter [Chryseobacterium sp. FH2]